MTAPTENDTEEPNKPDQTYGDPITTGHLLDEGTKDADVCKYLHDEWDAQKDRYARRICEDEVNRRRRSGEGNLWVEKATDNRALYKVYESHGKRFNQFAQKAGRLCLRAVAVLHPDPPEPEAIPQTGEASDRDAAEFTTRVLKDVGGESCLNDLEAHKQAFDLASNGGSGYIWYYTDPFGGGRQPIEVDAHPDAPHVDQALMDPMTGMPHNGPTVSKFVGPDGSLSDQKGQAAKRWVPKLARNVVHFAKVRLLPANATDLWDANGLLYADYHPWATLKGWFPSLAELGPEIRDKAIKYRLPGADFLLPKKGTKKHDPAPKPGHEDDGLALLMIKWCVEGPDYPDGAYIVTIGEDQVAHRGTWNLENEDGTTERRDIPFTQVQQFRGDQDNPTGWGFMDFLGPSNENRDEIYAGVLDMLDKLLNPKILLPLGSTLQPQDFESPFNTTLRFQPGYKPEQMEGPKIPAEAFKMLDEIKLDMNDATGMGQASAEGMEAPNVNSGRHALAIQSAQQASLSDINQNINRAFVRGWRIQCQAIKADYDVPQLVTFIDKDGDYKAQRWLGSDLGSTRDVQILRGTGTLFHPAQKTQYLTEYAQLAQVPPEEIQELLATGYNPYTSLQDDPHLLRVRRQIAMWEKGPPPGWVPPPPPAPPPVMGVDPMSGQPILGPQAPPPPYDPIFGVDIRLVDAVPVAASKRIRELGKAMASTKYGEQPPEWKAALDQEFSRAQQALAPPPQPMPVSDGPKPKGGVPGGPPPLTPMEQQVLGPSVGQPAGASPP